MNAKGEENHKIPAFVISLKDDIKLIEHKISETTSGRIGPIRKFEATNGKNPFKKVESKYMNQFFNEYLAPPSMAAIADSHMRAWEAFINNEEFKKNQICLFFEDDVFGSSKQDKKTRTLLFDSAISEFQKNAADILFLGYFNSSLLQLLMWTVGSASFPFKKQKRTNIISKNSIAGGCDLAVTKVPEVAVGFHAYALSKTGAAKLLKRLKGTVSSHVDFGVQKLICSSEIKALALKDRIFFQTSTATEDENEMVFYENRGGEHSQISNGKPLLLFHKMSSSSSESGGSSGSSCKTYPLLLTENLLKNVKVDECFSGKYIASNVVFHLFGSPYLKVTVTTLFLFVIGIILSFTEFFRGKNLLILIMFLLLLGIPDFVASFGNLVSISTIFFNIFAVVFPIFLVNLASHVCYANLKK